MISKEEAKEAVPIISLDLKAKTGRDYRICPVGTDWYVLAEDSGSMKRLKENMEYLREMEEKLGIRLIPVTVWRELYVAGKVIMLIRTEEGIKALVHGEGYEIRELPKEIFQLLDTLGLPTTPKNAVLFYEEDGDLVRVRRIFSLEDWSYHEVDGVVRVRLFRTDLLVNGRIRDYWHPQLVFEFGGREYLDPLVYLAERKKRRDRK